MSLANRPVSAYTSSLPNAIKIQPQIIFDMSFECITELRMNKGTVCFFSQNTNLMNMGEKPGEPSSRACTHTHPDIHIVPTHTHTHTHTNTNTIHTYTYKHTHINTHTPHTYENIHTHAIQTHTHTHTHIHIHKHTHIHTHMHTQTYTHIHISYIHTTHQIFKINSLIIASCQNCIFILQTTFGRLQKKCLPKDTSNSVSSAHQLIAVSLGLMQAVCFPGVHLYPGRGGCLDNLPDTTCLPQMTWNYVFCCEQYFSPRPGKARWQRVTSCLPEKAKFVCDSNI